MRANVMGVLCGFAGLLAFGPASTQPSFDCRRATQSDERAVCASPVLSRLDRQLASEYRAAQRRFAGDRIALAELTQQQTWFLGTRERVHENRLGATLTLDGLYRDRITELRRLSPRQTKWVGQWSGLSSRVTIISGRGGALSVSLSAVEPSAGRWVCDYENTPARQQGEDLVVTYPDENGKPVPIVISRVGGLLEVRFGEGTQFNCGMNGTVSGRYFPSGG
jgi:uncharacterized protein